MMLTTKGRYAVMAMVDLAACNAEQKPVTLSDVAERQEIALAYLEQIFSKLKKAQLVTSVRGPGGGYRLGKPERELTIAEIILAVDEPIKMTRCSSHEEGGCLSKKARCLTHDLWDGLGEQIYNYLNGITLKDVVEDNMNEAIFQPQGQTQPMAARV